MSGEKAVVTCQKYQFSENKKIGLFQPKACLDTWALAHVELKREHVVPAGQPQDHRSVRHHRFEPVRPDGPLKGRHQQGVYLPSLVFVFALTLAFMPAVKESSRSSSVSSVVNVLSDLPAR